MKQAVTSLESTAIEQQAKVTQLEAQLELNVSLLLSLIQNFTAGNNNFCFSMTE
jgi:hypothetical protein